MAILHLLLTVQFIRTVFFEYNQPVAPGKLDIPPISFQGRFDAKSQPLSHESPDSPVSDHTNSSRRCREPSETQSTIDWFARDHVIKVDDN